MYREREETETGQHSWRRAGKRAVREAESLQKEGKSILDLKISLRDYVLIRAYT